MEPVSLTLADRIAIVDANFGREFGWHVLSNSDEAIATLRDPIIVEMFWTSYIVLPMEGWPFVATKEFWYPECQRIRNIRFPRFVRDTFGHFDPNSKRVTVRNDYIDVRFRWFDRVRAPIWSWRRRS